jgi:glutamine amidotransferase
MKVAIIKYNSGNVQSVDYALQRLGIQAEITDDIQKINRADKVIFPGVGEASSTMKYLKDRKLDETIRDLKQPVLGICLGMQLLCSHSEEGDTSCIGIFPAKVRKFQPVNDDHSIKVPHMGWNQIQDLKGSLFSGVSENAFVYFVHSYYVESNEYESAKTDYILPYCSAQQKDNFYAVQFHPEKSSGVGAQILKNFIEL